jgi:hypothetical protein
VVYRSRGVKGLFFIFVLTFATNLFAAVNPRDSGWADRFFNRAWKAMSRFVTGFDVLSVPDGKK